MFCRRIFRIRLVNLEKNVCRKESSAANISKSDVNIDIPQATVPEIVYKRFEPFHKYTALECAISKKKYTFEDIRIKSRNLSKCLRKKLNLQKGDAAAIILSNRPEYAATFLGILEAGLVVTTMNPIYTPAEMAKQLKDAEVKVAITQQGALQNVKLALQSIQKNIPIILIKDKESDSLAQGTVDFDEFTNSVINIPDIEPVNPNDVAFMPYSSGTTGLPKGVELTHNNIVAMIYQQCYPDLDYVDPPTDNFQDVVPAILPFFHIFGATQCLINGLTRGINNVTLPRFHPESYVEILKNYKITIGYATPPLLLFLISNPSVKKEYLQHLKFYLSGAAPLGALDEERFKEKFGKNIAIYQGFGMSETALIATTCMKSIKSQVSGSCGKPVPNTAIKITKLDDPQGIALQPNEVGEILCKGPQVMKGYHQRPEETQNAFLDGWLRTGDIGYLDKDGFLYVQDRLKEIIKVNAYQVSPAELEEVIRNHPSVEDAGVIGIPHPVFGEVPRAYVVLKTNKKLDDKEIANYVEKNVVKYKRLVGGVKIVDSIPKNPSGKILRRELKQLFIEKGI